MTNNSATMFVHNSVYEYPLSWLDQLVTESLAPNHLNVKTIQKDELDSIVEILKQEDSRLKLLIKTQVFSLVSENDIENLIKRYYASIVMLMEQTLAHKKALGRRSKALMQIYGSIIDCLRSLLNFIETWFSVYLGQDERISPLYYAEIKEDLLRKLNSLHTRLEEHAPKKVADLVKRRIYRFLEQDQHPDELSMRSVSYKKELIHKLLDLDWQQDQNAAFSTIDELLIEMNFNSKSYIRVLTRHLSKQINAEGPVADKRKKLLFLSKAFNQLQINTDIAFKPKCPSLAAVMNNWFKQEIRYLENVVEPVGLAVKQNEKPKEKPVFEKREPSVTCMISVDQLSLIMRAADETRLFLAKSMSATFEAIIPHVSTARTKELSYNSVRRKSYNPEESDKQGAIAALEKLIFKIRGY